MQTKYIFVTGGVVSSLGKGIISASIGKLLQARGFKVTIQKFGPYINIDPGTLNPYEHGECYVTEDGFETDLDLGHYERFTGIRTTRNNSITTGRIYKTVIDRERRGALAIGPRCGLRAPDVCALPEGRRRVEDQTHPTLREGTAGNGHTARHPCAPYRTPP